MSKGIHFSVSLYSSVLISFFIFRRLPWACCYSIHTSHYPSNFCQKKSFLFLKFPAAWDSIYLEDNWITCPSLQQSLCWAMRLADWPGVGHLARDWVYPYPNQTSWERRNENESPRKNKATIARKRGNTCWAGKASPTDVHSDAFLAHPQHINMLSFSS